VQSLGPMDVRQCVERVILKFQQSRASNGSPPARSGVMARLVHLLMTSTFTSPYRFWLSSCIETFLRWGETIERGGGVLGPGMEGCMRVPVVEGGGV
jgi:hypothetical protein